MKCKTAFRAIYAQALSARQRIYKKESVYAMSVSFIYHCPKGLGFTLFLNCVIIRFFDCHGSTVM